MPWSVADGVHQFLRLIKRSDDHPKDIAAVRLPSSWGQPAYVRPRIWRTNMGYTNGAIAGQSYTTGGAGNSGIRIPLPRQPIWNARRPIYQGGNAGMPGSPTRAIPAVFAPTSLASDPSGRGSF